jgi:hypothetical protein
VTICVSGYTRSVRPTTGYTNRVKQMSMRAYGDTGPPYVFELDHLIPLELGGAPKSIANLWPEVWNGSDGAKAKDRIENELHNQVCAGTMQLGVAQQRIAVNWTTALGNPP